MISFTSCSSSETSPRGPVSRTAGDRYYRFTYETKIPVPDGAKQVSVWVPLPLEDPGVQSVYDLQHHVTGGVATITREGTHGNRMLHVRGSGAAKTIDIRWTANILRAKDTGQGTLPNRAVYLQGTSLVPIDGEAARLADRLGTRNALASTEMRARLIYSDVLDSMAYDKSGEGWGRGDFHHSVTVCRGNCTDFHARFIGVARASTIPTRFTMGIPLKPTPKGAYNSYHCWAHWYDQGTWKPVDISEADKVAETDPAKAASFFGTLDPDRLSLSFGRDVNLEPRQATGPLNYFVFPHAEADGAKIPLTKDNWNFGWENLP